MIDTVDRVMEVIGSSPLIGLDLETTGLDPRRDLIRLLTVGTPTGDIAVLDCESGIPDWVLRALEVKTLVAHNAIFDLSFLWEAGMRNIPRTICTRLLSQLLLAGEESHGYPSTSLGSCASRWLNQTLDKSCQKSDWSGVLSKDQLDYARRDVEILFPLLRVLLEEIEKADLGEVAELELAALPAFVWLSVSGVAVDKRQWQQLTYETVEEKRRLIDGLNASSPPKNYSQPGLFGEVETWNWDSSQQVVEVFRRKGIELSTTCDARLAQLESKYPLAKLLREYRKVSKRLSSFGEDWLQWVQYDGRLYPSWQQIGAVAGRTSCKDPNMQQIPRSGGYRECVKALQGRVLIKADYSQIELRIACKIAGESRMLSAFHERQDLHKVTAAFMLDKPIESITPPERQIAKSANFGLLYGMGVQGYRVYAQTTYGIEMTAAQAENYHKRFFAAYPALSLWHKKARLPLHETRTLCGRRRLLQGVISDTIKLNTPVQGTGADGIKLALGKLWEQRSKYPEVFPVMVVHDEIVMESPKECAEEVGEWLRDIMVSVMQPICAPVPVEVDVSIGPSWGK